MNTPFEIHGIEFDICNCAYGCPCQFNAPPTYGDCQYVLFVSVDRGHYGDVDLAGVRFVLYGKFPGAVHEGNGTMQLVIDEAADEAQREAVKRIVHNMDTDDIKTHFAVYSGMSTTLYDPIIAPMELEVDIRGRTGRGHVPGLIEASAEPIRNPVTGAEHRAQIVLPEGFEYTVAEMGSGTATTYGTVPLNWADRYAQFNELHINQDGVIR